MSRRRRTPHVTDHAVLRYMQRAEGVDVEAKRKEIARLVQNGVDQDACGVIRDGLRFVLVDASVVTVQEATFVRGSGRKVAE